MNNLPNNPQIIPHKSGQEFRYFCQKVLPAVYDESLSYYELLCKLTAKINEIINTQNTQVDSITELQNLFVELTDYVNNYFLELNVQEQINNKLDIMSSDGTLASIINEQIFDELNSKIDTNTEDITSLGGRVTNAESDIQTNKNDIQTNTESIQTNTTSIATVNGRVDSLEDYKNMIKQEIIVYVAPFDSQLNPIVSDAKQLKLIFRKFGNIVNLIHGLIAPLTSSVSALGVYSNPECTEKFNRPDIFKNINNRYPISIGNYNFSVNTLLYSLSLEDNANITLDEYEYTGSAFMFSNFASTQSIPSNRLFVGSESILYATYEE